MKKKYSIPSTISQDISNTIEIAQNNLGNMNYRLVPLSSIDTDPNNPRDLAISKQDIIDGFSKEDPLYDRKTEEYESLKLLANSIAKHDVRIPIEIYKFGAGYRLVHGERRYLASLIAKRTIIPAKVLDKQPTEFDLRVLQLIENAQRENLSLYESLNNIKMIVKAYQENVDSTTKVDAHFIHNVIYKSLSQSYNYLAALNAPEEVWNAIKKGEIQNLEKAAFCASEPDVKRRGYLLQTCIQGKSIKELREIAKRQDDVEIISKNTLANEKRRGKRPSRVYLGGTVNKGVVKKIIKLVSEDKNYYQFGEVFKRLQCKELGDCTKSFATLISIMEKVEKNQ